MGTVLPRIVIEHRIVVDAPLFEYRANDLTPVFLGKAREVYPGMYLELLHITFFCNGYHKLGQCVARFLLRYGSRSAIHFGLHTHAVYVYGLCCKQEKIFADSAHFQGIAIFSANCRRQWQVRWRYSRRLLRAYSSCP